MWVQAFDFPAPKKLEQTSLVDANQTAVGLLFLAVRFKKHIPKRH